MNQDIEEKKKLLEREKEKIRLKEKLLREKEQQRRAKGFAEIGRLAGKVDIDGLHRDALLGAFLEISERSKDEKTCNAWQEKASTFLKKQQDGSRVPLSVSFKVAPDKQAKEKLRKAGFRWNPFRKEFHGYGEKVALQQLLVGLEHEIEVLA